MYLTSPNSAAVVFSCWLFGDRLVRISINFDEHRIWRGLQGYCRHIMNNLYLVPNVTVIVVNKRNQGYRSDRIHAVYY